jgi:subtilisin family serine protease
VVSGRSSGAGYRFGRGRRHNRRASGPSIRRSRSTTCRRLRGAVACQFGDGSDVANLGPTFACNRKLVGAYAFTATYLSINAALPGEFCNNATKVCSARDPNGHGTHTSSTAAGSRVDSAPLYGVERGPISGMAPGARVIMYRVCLDEGCYSSDSVAAVQQAILDEVDVINFSISGGANPYSDAVSSRSRHSAPASPTPRQATPAGAATVDHETIGDDGWSFTSNRFHLDLV